MKRRPEGRRFVPHMQTAIPKRYHVLPRRYWPASCRRRIAVARQL